MKNSALERGLERLLGLGRHLPSLAIEGQLLAAPRRAEIRRLLDRHLPQVSALSPRIVARDPGAIEAYDRAIDEAIGSLRNPRVQGLPRVLSALDRGSMLLRPEYCDDASCPEPQRRTILASIDWVNEGLGSYLAWSRLMAADLAPVAGRPTRVLDLAAGHGGFALALKELHGGAIDVTASDIFEEYLAMGRDQARRRGLDVSFRRQDATDLRSLAAEHYDVIVCTQSIHHFPPGMVARMLGEAARIAGRAVWFIDAERSLLAAALLGTIIGAQSRAWPVVHDTVVSLRKMYAEEELALIGSLTPGLPPGSHVSTGRKKPGFAHLRVAPRP